MIAQLLTEWVATVSEDQAAFILIGCIASGVAIGRMLTGSLWPRSCSCKHEHVETTLTSSVNLDGKTIAKRIKGR